MNAFLTQVKREYWEHRGGLLFAPLVTAGVVVFLVIVGWIMAVAIVGKVSGNVSMGLNIGQLISKNVTDDMLPELARGYDIGLLGLSSLIQLVLTIVVFFYCIGALYDDRRDRSILFWKSMPVSDVSTVLAKLLTVAVLAPLIAFAATVILHVVVLAVLSLIATVHGNSAMRLVIGPAEPLALWPKMFVYLFANALWLAPMFGWLLLASSFARSKAFLWAVFPPLILGIAWSATEIYRFLWLPQMWVWKNVVGRVLPFFAFESQNGGSVRFLSMRIGNGGPTLEWSDVGAVLTNLETWYGVIAAAVMIAGAIWFRRTRELAD
jgi:ABC-2 type transport system permease protein